MKKIKCVFFYILNKKTNIENTAQQQKQEQEQHLNEFTWGIYATSLSHVGCAHPLWPVPPGLDSQGSICWRPFV